MKGSLLITTLPEAPLSVTVRSGKDYDASLLTVRGANAQELESNLLAVEAGGSLATIGRIAAAFAAQFNLGNKLGAQGMDAPVNVPDHVPAEWTVANTAPAAPAYQAPAAPVAAAPPGVPTILGQPAKWIDKGTWKAWADPRSQAETQHLTQKTDNPNHPGLAGQTHKFWQFVR